MVTTTLNTPWQWTWLTALVELPEPLDHLDPKAPPDCKVPQDRLVLREPQGPLARREPTAHRVPRARPAHKDRPDLRAPSDRKERLELQEPSDR